MSNIFDTNYSLKPPLNSFNLGHSVYYDIDIGKLVPIEIIDCLPGDRFDLKVKSFVRMAPMVSPEFTPITQNFLSFFVAYRTLWDQFHKFITGGKVNGNSKPFNSPPPQYKLVASNSGYTGTEYVTPEKFSPADYSGIVPITSFSDNPSAKGIIPIDAFPALAYEAIFNNWFKEQNIQDLTDDDIQGIDFNNDERFQAAVNFFKASGLKTLNYARDYFTSAFLSQQQGNPITVPFSAHISTASSSSAGDNTANRLTAGFIVGVQHTSSGPSYIQNTKPFHFTPLGRPTAYVSKSSNEYTSASSTQLRDSLNATYGPPQKIFGIGIDDTTNLPVGDYPGYMAVGWSSSDFNRFFQDSIIQVDEGPTVSNLRTAFQTSLILENLLYSGYRYKDFLQFFFGISPNDETLQRPDLIGGHKTQIAISEVVQTSATTNDSPLGSLGGHGINSDYGSLGKYTVKEFGCIVIVTWLSIPAYYFQGTPKEWNKPTRLHYYNPAYVNLSQQPLYNKEVFTSLDQSYDEGVFGYQGIYNEYRVKQDRIAGNFRDKLLYWHMARKFSNTSKPYLNTSFIQYDTESTKRIFAYQGTDEPSFYCKTYLEINSARPLPLRATPGLIDHIYGA